MNRAGEREAWGLCWIGDPTPLLKCTAITPPPDGCCSGLGESKASDCAEVGDPDLYEKVPDL